MPDQPKFARLSLALALVASVVLLGAAVVVDLLAEEVAPAWWRVVLVTTGCALGVVAVVARRSRLISTLGKISLLILSAALALGIGELVPRAVDYNFATRREPGPEIPIYYRAPSLHAGEGIFRRPGPASWQGRVLCAFMRSQHWNEAPYADEQPIQADYDQFGFRNPTNLLDWEVVVAGDSFVELGHLPYEELFTTRAGKQSGLRIKNLGVSTTGPISQTFYVQHYGRAASTREAVLCFFEGNDLDDLTRELRQTEFFRSTGRPWEEERQPSLLRALLGRVNHVAKSRTTGTKAASLIPLVDAPSFGKLPPAWEQCGPAKRASLAQALNNWAATTRSLGLRPWVLYLPDGQRVFHGLEQHALPGPPPQSKAPGDFASGLGAACTNAGVRFINAYPALRQAAEAGQVPYNRIGDGHFNRTGSRIVATVLSEALPSGQ